ncbi:PH domain-containing protein [bacterium]|nr:PH domain-containing protein [bacterium]
MEVKPCSKLLSRIHLDYLTVVVFAAILAAILSVIIALAEPEKLETALNIIWGITLGLSVLGWILLAIIVPLWVKNLSYSIEEDRITVNKGVLTKVQQNIPYRAITDFQLHRSLWDRALGIGSIRIQTAGQHTGGTGYEGVLSGLLDYEDLHTQLRAKLNKLHPVSDSVTGVTEKSASIKDDGFDNVRYQILEELRAIRKAVEK